MNNLNVLLLLFLMKSLLTACQTFRNAGDVLRNKKKASTDEFLIQKREPLAQPPEFYKLPKPGRITKKAENSRIKKILKIPDEKTISADNKPSSSESSIIKKLNSDK